MLEECCHLCAEPNQWYRRYDTGIDVGSIDLQIIHAVQRSRFASQPHSGTCAEITYEFAEQYCVHSLSLQGRARMDFDALEYGSRCQMRTLANG